MRSILTFFCLVWCVTPSAFWNIIAYPISKKWARAISEHIAKVIAYRVFSILKFLCGYHYIGENKSKAILPDQYILISNHQSLFDIPALMRFFRERNIRFVAKDNLARHIPLVSEMLRAAQHCMIPRSGSPMKAMKVLESFGYRILKYNQIPVIFPEGTRSKTGNVGRFHTAGLRKLLEVTKLPIAVCALDGGWQIRDVRHIMTNLKGGYYHIKILKVFPTPKTKQEEEDILQESKSLIQNQLDLWRSAGK